MDRRVVPLSLVPTDNLDAVSISLVYMREALQLLDDDAALTIVAARLSDCIDQLERLTNAAG